MSLLANGISLLRQSCRAGFSVARLGLALILVFCVVPGCVGQGTTGQNANGTKPFWTYLQNRETISPSSGNMMVTIPLVHLPGRDGHDLNFSLIYNSQSGLKLNEIVISAPAPSGPTSGDQSPYNPSSIVQYQNLPNYQWTWNNPVVLEQGATFDSNYIGGSTDCSGNYMVKTSSSATYTFGAIDTGCQDVEPFGVTQTSGVTVPIATDDSLQGVILDAVAPVGPTAYFPDGKRLIGISNGALDVDPNGNYITYNYLGTWLGQPSPPNASITDTLGRTINWTQTQTGQQLQYYNSEGTLETITVNYGAAPQEPTITLPAPVGMPTGPSGCGTGDCFIPGPSQVAHFMLSSIVFPDGSSYSFEYDNLGDMIKIGYPGGGYTRYEYNTLAQRMYYIPGLTPNSPNQTEVGVSPQVSAKYTCSDTGIPYGTTTIPAGNTCSVPELKTTYNPTPAGAYNIYNTVTEPDGTSTAYVFNHVYPSQTTAGSAGNALAITADFTPVELGHITTDVNGLQLEQVINTFESDAMHLKSRSTKRLHGVNTLETWTNVATQLPYGATYYNGAIYPLAYLWTTQSLETDDLNTGAMIDRHDYTWYAPGFDPTMPYFDNLKLTDSLFDPAVGGYTEQLQNQYDGNSIVSSGVPSSPTYSASLQHLTLTGTARGNLTAALHWSNTYHMWLGTQKYFDDAGNVVMTVDPNRNQTTYSYADSWATSGCPVMGTGPTAAYLTGVTNALGQSASSNYNPCTGTVASKTDANGQTMRYTYWPSTEQLASVSAPDGGLTTYCYENTAPCAGSSQGVTNYTLTTHAMSPDPVVINEQDFDGLGRTIASKIMSDPWCPMNGTETKYDNRERVYQTTFPHCAGVTGAATTLLYNGLGYPTSKQVTGAVARKWTYNGQSDTETDEVGNVTTRTVDSVNRLVQVMEPGPYNTPLYETDYTYDAANNLKQVDQWGGPSGNAGDRQRKFTYDTLSQLTYALNPEAGGLSYQYDYNGNLTGETDARNITATRNFDALNRLVETSYSDGTPTECFAYDKPIGGVTNTYPIGRLVADWTQNQTSCPQAGLPSASVLVTERLIGVSSNSQGSGSSQGYDPMGRLTDDLQCPSAPCTTMYPSHYAYDLGGIMNNQVLSGLPTGGVVGGNLSLTHSYDAAGRAQMVTSNWSDAMHPATLFEADGTTNPSLGTPYGPFGLLNAAYGLGSGNFTQTTTSRTYDTHGRAQSETDRGAALTTAIPATTAIGTIDVSMTEQFTPALSTPAIGTITITEPYGVDPTSAGCNCSETGILGAVVGNVTEVIQDGPTSSTSGLATALAAAFNSDCNSMVTAISSANVVTLIAKTTGTATNYPMHMIAESTNPAYFSTPAFLTEASGATMSGGVAGTGTSVPDSGTVTVTVGSLPSLSLNWNQADNAGELAGRLATLINKTPSYASVLTAAASGSQVVLTAINGGSAGNMSVSTQVTYDSQQFAYSSVAVSALPMLGGTDGASPHGATLAYQYNNAQWQDNGSLGSVTDSVFGQQMFRYDTLNRLVSDVITGPTGTGSLNWGYDAFGNRLMQSGVGQLSFTLTQMTASYNGNSLQNGGLLQGAYNNRMDGVNHDASGNVLQYGISGLTYDAASRLKTVGGVEGVGGICYVYNAEGIRTAKGMWNGTACANITAQYILGPGGEQVTELDGLVANAIWAHTNVYGAGKMLATYDNVGLHFHFADWLGTNRVQMNADGAVEETCLSLPFGDSLSCSGPGTDATEHHFTGKERDAESGLDYFGARYFGSNTGRWMSPDWAAKAEPIPYAKMDWPQSFNLYGYVENNPLSVPDKDGHCGEAAPIHCSPEQDREADSGEAQSKARATQAAANAEDPKQKAIPAQPQTAQQQAAQVPGAVKAAIMNSVNASSAPSGNDTTGGFHEESGVAGTNAAGGLVISPDKPGGYSNPDTSNHVSTTHTPVDQDQRNSITNFTVFWHVHPSGTTATHGWVQPPSAQDQSVVVPGPINIVVGAGNRTVYFYNGSSVQSMSLKNFMKP